MSNDQESLIVPVSEIETYHVPFTRNLTWKQRIERWKQNETDGIDPDIWKYYYRFAIEPEDEAPLDIQLDHFVRQVSSDGVERRQAKNSKQMISPARFLHLLELYPDLQCKHPIICTIAVCVDRYGLDRVLCADECGDRRHLYLGYRDADWPFSCYFPSSTPKIA